MIVCGIEMSASEARLVVLKGTRANYSFVDLKPRKLVLADDESQDAVKAFQDTVFAFLRENLIDKVVIKKRMKRGEFSGGPVGFKMEGIVQLYPGCQISLLSAPTVAAVMRRNSLMSPKGMVKYQQAAFETAYSGLS